MIAHRSLLMVTTGVLAAALPARSATLEFVFPPYRVISVTSVEALNDSDADFADEVYVESVLAGAFVESGNASASVSDPIASADGGANQNSQVGANGISGSGNVSAVATTQSGGFTSAQVGQAYSALVVTFTVSQTSAWRLSGTLAHTTAEKAIPPNDLATARLYEVPGLKEEPVLIEGFDSSSSPNVDRAWTLTSGTNYLLVFEAAADALGSDGGDSSGTAGWNLNLAQDTPPCVCGDFNGDNIINLIDFGSFALCANLTEPNDVCLPDLFTCTDLNSDGRNSLSDFTTFATIFSLSPNGISPPDCGLIAD